MNIKKLDWDSRFFGIKVGKIDISVKDTFDYVGFESQALSENYRLIYVIKQDEILPGDFTVKGNFKLMDIQLVASRQISIKETFRQPYKLRTLLNEKELKECYEIAEQVSEVSRFNYEPLIGPQKTREMYRKWVDNAIDSSFNDGILLYKEKNKVIGLHIIRSDQKTGIGYCSLIGVDRDHKRMNVGNKLWDMAISYWAYERGFDKFVVPFSLQNLSSFNFHLKLGFNKIQEVKYIYHYKQILK